MLPRVDHPLVSAPSVEIPAVNGVHSQSQKSCQKKHKKEESHQTKAVEQGAIRDD